VSGPADIMERARKYVSRMDPAIAGSGGHTATFKAAVALAHGFALSWNEAWVLLLEYNERCQPRWSPKELEHKLKQAVNGTHKHARGHLLGDRVDAKGRSEKASVASAAAAPGTSFEDARNWREYDPAALAAEQRPVRIGAKWLASRSLVDPAGVTPGRFLDELLLTGDKAIVFTSDKSQGQYMYWRAQDVERRGWYQLGDRKGVPARKVGAMDETPRSIISARCGVWWLCQPVDGQWRPNGERLSRRSEASVAAWRHMVIESDEDGIEEQWLNLLVQLPLRIVAMYTSGGRSVHALVRVDAQSKANWDMIRDYIKPMMTRWGADKGVFSAVRLTRLPGCLRRGKESREGGYEAFSEPRMQRLLYLNPLAGWTPIQSLPVLRVSDESTNRSNPNSSAAA
jgi:hypothetical protein